MMQIEPRSQNLAQIPILRVLPYRKRRHVGPFVFLDHIGPHVFAAGAGMDVMAHPHIGLSTITYVFEGAIVHRDSLGTVQTLKPGDVNWMKTGRGLAHAERTPAADRQSSSRLHAVQAWMVLPEAQSEDAPQFMHLDGAELPRMQCGAARLRLLGGALPGAQLPVPQGAPHVFYAEVRSDALGEAVLPHPEAEAGFYLVSGAVRVGEQLCCKPRLFVFDPGETARITFVEPSVGMWLGGPALPKSPVMWWNFVASSQARIEQAKADWQQGRFTPVPGETVSTPLPSWPAAAAEPL